MSKKVKSILDFTEEQLADLAKRTGRTVSELRASAEREAPTKGHPVSKHMQDKMNSGSY